MSSHAASDLVDSTPTLQRCEPIVLKCNLNRGLGLERTFSFCRGTSLQANQALLGAAYRKESIKQPSINEPGVQRSAKDKLGSAYVIPGRLKVDVGSVVLSIGDPYEKKALHKWHPMVQRVSVVAYQGMECFLLRESGRSLL